MLLVLAAALLHATSAGASAASAFASPAVSLRSGALRLTMGTNGSYSLAVDGEPPVRGAPLSVFADGVAHTVVNDRLRCPAAPAASRAASSGRGGA